MFSPKAIKTITATCLLSFLSIPMASAKPHPHDKPSKPNMVKPSTKPIVKPTLVKPKSSDKPIAKYDRKSLPARAITAVFAGITYAVIDNLYYKKSGEHYIYDPKPPKHH